MTDRLSNSNNATPSLVVTRQNSLLLFESMRPPCGSAQPSPLERTHPVDQGTHPQGVQFSETLADTRRHQEAVRV